MTNVKQTKGPDLGGWGWGGGRGDVGLIYSCIKIIIPTAFSRSAKDAVFWVTTWVGKIDGRSNYSWELSNALHKKKRCLEISAHSM